MAWNYTKSALLLCLLGSGMRALAGQFPREREWLAVLIGFALVGLIVGVPADLVSYWRSRRVLRGTASRRTPDS